MAEPLTIAEIEARYPDEWILIENPQVNELNQVKGGTVICHSKDRDEVYRHMVGLRPARAATLFTGSMPEGTAIVV